MPKRADEKFLKGLFMDVVRRAQQMYISSVPIQGLYDEYGKDYLDALLATQDILMVEDGDLILTKWRTNE